MELRSYATIIWRRIWIVALVFGIVALYTGYQYYQLQKKPGALSSYHSDIVVRIGLESTSPTDNVKKNNPQAAPVTDNNLAYGDYIITAEALADEFVTGPVLNSQAFAELIYQQLQSDHEQIVQRFGTNPDLGDPQAETIAGTLTATRVHSLVTIRSAWSTSAGAWALSNAVGEVLIGHINTYVNYAVTTTANTSATTAVGAEVVNPTTDPVSGIGTASTKATLLLVLLLVALVIGIALAFLIEYLDDRIRSQEEVALLLQLPVYGEIPRAPVTTKK